ncbi:hypothetical protein [Kitasatospora sp. NPDC097643]|uniref:hypothetical protein n=1 Tax=Kitasatospora sp. NPDC097643 TaxID=3157230 RepID=UPI003333A6DE
MEGNALGDLIDGLVPAFAAAPRPTRIDACPCGNCGWQDTVETLLRTPLTRLGPDELGRYAFSVLNTVGSAEDLRYFAPRILHLSLTDELLLPDLELIADALARARWRSWPEAPYLHKLFDALWADVLHNTTEWWDAEAVLCALGAAELRIDGHLAAWARLDTPPAVERLHDLVRTRLHLSRDGLLRPQNAYWQQDGPAYRTLLDWLNADGPHTAAAAVEAAFARATATTGPDLLEQLVAVHDVLTTHRS